MNIESTCAPVMLFLLVQGVAPLSRPLSCGPHFHYGLILPIVFSRSGQAQVISPDSPSAPSPLGLPLPPSSPHEITCECVRTYIHSPPTPPTSPLFCDAHPPHSPHPLPSLPGHDPLLGSSSASPRIPLISLVNRQLPGCGCQRSLLMLLRLVMRPHLISLP